jgi:hypothetical protein
MYFSQRSNQGLVNYLGMRSIVQSFHAKFGYYAPLASFGHMLIILHATNENSSTVQIMTIKKESVFDMPSKVIVNISEPALLDLGQVKCRLGLTTPSVGKRVHVQKRALILYFISIHVAM